MIEKETDELIKIFKQHTEYWKSQIGCSIPFDYERLRDKIKNKLIHQKNDRTKKHNI